jgi:hypothetical protein
MFGLGGNLVHYSDALVFEEADLCLEVLYFLLLAKLEFGVGALGF